MPPTTRARCRHSTGEAPGTPPRSFIDPSLADGPPTHPYGSPPATTPLGSHPIEPQPTSVSEPAATESATLETATDDLTTMTEMGSVGMPSSSPTPPHWHAPGPLPFALHSQVDFWLPYDAYDPRTYRCKDFTPRLDGVWYSGTVIGYSKPHGFSERLVVIQPFGGGIDLAKQHEVRPSK